MYGENCAEKCGSCFNSECHHFNGTCMKGCDRGFHGPKCIKGNLIYNTIKSSCCFFASKVFHFFFVKMPAKYIRTTCKKDSFTLIVLRK